MSSTGSFRRVYRGRVGRKYLYVHSTIGHGKGSRPLIFGTTTAVRFPNFPWEQQALERESGGTPQHPLPLLPPSSDPPIFLIPQAMKEVVRTVSALLVSAVHIRTV